MTVVNLCVPVTLDLNRVVAILRNTVLCFLSSPSLRCIEAMPRRATERGETGAAASSERLPLFSRFLRWGILPATCLPLLVASERASSKTCCTQHIRCLQSKAVDSNGKQWEAFLGGRCHYLCSYAASIVSCYQILLLSAFALDLLFRSTFFMMPTSAQSS